MKRERRNASPSSRDVDRPPCAQSMSVAGGVAGDDAKRRAAGALDADPGGELDRSRRAGL